MASTKPTVVFVLGGPGSGKGSVCSKLVDDFAFVHISAGDLLREARESGTGAEADLIRKCIDEGSIVPVEITVRLIQKRMEEKIAATKRSHFLIDGFPRNADNLDGWKRVIGDVADVKFCLFMDCDESVMEKRLLGRAAVEGRSDDNLATIKKRFNTYVKDTAPIISLFAKDDKVVKIDARPEREAVYAAVKAEFAKRFPQLAIVARRSLQEVVANKWVRVGAFAAFVAAAVARRVLQSRKNKL